MYDELNFLIVDEVNIATTIPSIVKIDIPVNGHFVTGQWVASMEFSSLFHGNSVSLETKINWH